MLTLNPKDRITTVGVLEHPWMTQVQSRMLDGTIRRMIHFNVKRKFRATVRAVTWGSGLLLRRRLRLTWGVREGLLDGWMFI
jgi:hypothetical protein